MLKVEIEIKTKNKNEVPAIMKEIAEKIQSGIDMSNAEKYYFKLKD
jgi:hypothetical protein